MSIAKLSPNWAYQMGPIHSINFLLSGISPVSDLFSVSIEFLIIFANRPTTNLFYSLRGLIRTNSFLIDHIFISKRYILQPVLISAEHICCYWLGFSLPFCRQTLPK